MKDFEELLEETLQDVREAEPSTGMDDRIIARVATEAKAGPRWSLLTGAVAAAFLVAVLFQTRTQLTEKPLIAPHVAPLGGNRPTTDVSLSAEGATYTSLGRRPGYEPHQIRRGLKVRYIGDASNFARNRSLRFHSSRGPTLRIAPIVIASLRMEPIEVASLTLKNSNEKGDAQ